MSERSERTGWLSADANSERSERTGWLSADANSERSERTGWLSAGRERGLRAAREEAA